MRFCYHYCFVICFVCYEQVMGDLALQKPKENDVVSGILVKRNFNCHIISPKELGSEYFFLPYRCN